MVSSVADGSIPPPLHRRQVRSPTSTPPSSAPAFPMRTSPPPTAGRRLVVFLRRPVPSTGGLTIFIIVAQLILLHGILVVGEVAGAGAKSGSSRSSLRDVAMHLRAGDLRLVHFDSSDLTRDRQGDGDDDSCGAHLDEAYQVLMTASASTSTTEGGGEDVVSLPEDVVHAARVVTLCTTENPTVRARLPLSDEDGDGAGGVPAGLAAVIRNFADGGSGDHRDVIAAEAAAAAAETVWISSFASPRNHAAFSADGGVVDALVDLLCLVDCAAPVIAEATEDGTTKSSSSSSSPHCHHALMWAAAAVQNLAASYCQTDSGHCWWEWAHEGRSLTLHPESPLLVDAEPTRRRLLTQRDGCLLSRLEELVCAGPVDQPHRDREYPWPSRAQVLPDYVHENDRTSSLVNGATLVPWAAVGAIKNLALSPSFPRRPTTLIGCLCDHAVRGPDWLEYTKAQSALYHMGLDFEEDCPPLYDPAECRDDPPDWVDGEGNGCDLYEEERWCVEYGAEEMDHRTGVRAEEACCACGGGMRTRHGDAEEEL